MPRDQQAEKHTSVVATLAFSGTACGTSCGRPRSFQLHGYTVLTSKRGYAIGVTGLNRPPQIRLGAAAASPWLDAHVWCLCGGKCTCYVLIYVLCLIYAHAMNCTWMYDLCTDPGARLATFPAPRPLAEGT